MNLKSIALPLLACSSMGFANLIIDPSFEGNGQAVWNVIPAAQGSGWGSTSDAHSGNKAFAFFGQNSDTLFQDITLEIGVTYEISLWIKNYGVGDDSFSATLFGTDEANSIIMNPVGTPLEEWVQLSFTSTAIDTNGRIILRGKDQISSVIIDDISVEAVPEPATLAVLAGIAAIIKRRKSR